MKHKQENASNNLSYCSRDLKEGDAIGGDNVVNRDEVNGKTQLEIFVGCGQYLLLGCSEHGDWHELYQKRASIKEQIFTVHNFEKNT